MLALCFWLTEIISGKITASYSHSGKATSLSPDVYRRNGMPLVVNTPNAAPTTHSDQPIPLCDAVHLCQGQVSGM